MTHVGVLNEKVEGLSLKMFKFVKEYQRFLIPHIEKIVMQANIRSLIRNGYNFFLYSAVLVEKKSKKGLKWVVL
ncbi:MAG TPA: hypothetical protein ACFYD7_04975 [Candidatus Wujingus californicus]|uniref:hypothetical protein n=1 Tax=Candidatus Wujingus californicus TaxID=3367618 RepID=UPI001DBD1A11|nr:hypothetical protein [Planctomycetota bacterium]MDO8130443.1 hypothetical protein [Candidatus Brocadiales bacterium]